MKFKAASLSDIGLYREMNEDSYCEFEPENEELRKKRGVIFIVADGMGGHQGGEVASKLAVENVKERYYAAPGTNAIDALRDAFRTANKVIFDSSLEDASLFGMGTTCTAMTLVGDEAFFMHVGDSRAYVCRNGDIEQLTRDHTLVEDMVAPNARRIASELFPSDPVTGRALTCTRSFSRRYIAACKPFTLA